MKKLTEYRALIVDLDGTLYYQKPVRLAILKEMLFHFWKLPDFLIVKKYRTLFENGISEKERLSRLPSQAPRVIREWMIERPYPYIKKNGDYELINVLMEAQARGIIVIVYSDYPVEEKLSALGFVPDMALCSETIGRLKPDASGLKSVLTQESIVPEQCLVIGDRIDKDGALADNLDANILLLSQNPVERGKKYMELGWD